MHRSSTGTKSCTTGTYRLGKTRSCHESVRNHLYHPENPRTSRRIRLCWSASPAPWPPIGSGRGADSSPASVFRTTKVRYDDIVPGSRLQSRAPPGATRRWLVRCVGAGPASVFFAAILRRRAPGRARGPRRDGSGSPGPGSSRRCRRPSSRRQGNPEARHDPYSGVHRDGMQVARHPCRFLTTSVPRRSRSAWSPDVAHPS